MKRLLPLTVLVWLLGTGPAVAQLQPGSELTDMCFSEGQFADEKLKEVAEGICWGYIVGVGDVAITGNMVSGVESCAPLGPGAPTRGTVIDLVKAYLRANADRMGLPAYVLVAEALRDAFPCE